MFNEVKIIYILFYYLDMLCNTYLRIYCQSQNHIEVMPSFPFIFFESPMCFCFIIFLLLK